MKFSWLFLRIFFENDANDNDSHLKLSTQMRMIIIYFFKGELCISPSFQPPPQGFQKEKKYT